MKPTDILRSVLFGSLVLATTPLLHAAALYWDGTSTTADADGGDGTWTAADAWDTAATAGVNATWTTGSQAVFGGTVAGTVTLDTGITLDNAAGPTNAINFTKTGYLIDAASAQTITLGNASLISGNGWTFNPNVNFDNAGFNLTVSNGGTSEIKGVISGAGLLVKGGGGGLVLSGLNSYTGKTNINQGTITVNTLKDLSASSSLGAPTTAANGTILLGTGLLGGTLRYTGTGDAEGTTNRVIDLATTSSGAVIDHSGTGLLKFSSAFTATGRGSKTLTLTGSTAGTGEVAGAIVNATSGGTSLAATFASDASTVTLASVDGVSIGATISGTGIDPGTTITAIDTGTKTVTLSAVTTGASGVVGSIYNVTGVLNLTSLTKNGSGTWTLSATNTFTGGVSINAGTLKLGLDNRIADGITSFAITGGTFDAVGFVEGVTPAITMADGTITGTAGGYLLARGGYSGTGTNLISKRITVRAADANSGLFDISSGTTTVSGIIYSDNSTVQGITKTGGGTLILGNAANSYTGATAINGGTLALGANDVLPDASTITLGAATLDAATFDDTVGILDVTGGATINLGAGANLVFQGATATWAGTLNLTGTFVPGNLGSLKFGSSATALTDIQLGLISATGWTDFDLDVNGFLTASPTGGTTYADWLAANAPATGFETDTDKDGIPNGVENVLGSNPNTYNSGLTEVSSTTNSVFFQHTLNPTVASDVSYSYQWSTDLVEWKASTETNTGGTTVTINPSAPALGVVTVTITITDGPSAKLFGRLIAVK
jgi:autotransporter-associated beta strand protein